MKKRQELKIGFTGIGNMGGALLNALVSSGLTDPEKIYIYDIDAEKCLCYKDKYGIQITSCNEDIARQSDIIFLSVKPQVMEEVLCSMSPYFSEKHIVISIAAGLPLTFLKRYIKKGHILRAMPNTPCLVRHGFTALTTESTLKKDDKEIIENLFNFIGECLWLDEKYFHIITALSGSGPAYVFSFLEGLVEGGVKMGLNRKEALAAVIQTVQGSLELLKTTGKHPSQLKDMVTSPGGTTIHALEALHENRFHFALMQALTAAVNRSENLEKELLQQKSGSRRE